MATTIKKGELEKLYRENPNWYLCGFFGISKTTLITLLKKNGITLKGKGNRKGYPKISVI
jgi:hypothetical protein